MVFNTWQLPTVFFYVFFLFFLFLRDFAWRAKNHIAITFSFIQYITNQWIVFRESQKNSDQMDFEHNYSEQRNFEDYLGRILRKEFCPKQFWPVEFWPREFLPKIKKNSVQKNSEKILKYGRGKLLALSVRSCSIYHIEYLKKMRENE